MLIAWTCCCLFDVSGLTLSLPGLWITSTFIKAKVLCHCNGLSFACTLYSKILQGYNVHVDFRFVQPQIMPSRFQATHYRKKFIHMNWSSPLISMELLAPISNDHPSWSNKMPMTMSLAHFFHLKRLSKHLELESGQQRQLALDLPKGLVIGLIPILN